MLTRFRRKPAGIPTGPVKSGRKAPHCPQIRQPQQSRRYGRGREFGQPDPRFRSAASNPHLVDEAGDHEEAGWAAAAHRCPQRLVSFVRLPTGRHSIWSFGLEAGISTTTLPTRLHLTPQGIVCDSWGQLRSRNEEDIGSGVSLLTSNAPKVSCQLGKFTQAVTHQLSHNSRGNMAYQS